jgi:DHA3 family macrolide efflux protein-like MFS transporter
VIFMEKLTGWRGFLAVWAGQSVSRIGTGMYAFGVGVFVYQRTQSATLFGLILFFELLPGALIAPYAGVVADRVNRRTVMMFGNAGMIGGALVVLVATMGDHVNVWVLYPALVVGSLAAAFHAAAYDSSIVLLMPESRWNRANGLVQLGEAIANVSAPLAAGAVLVALSISGLILLDIATFGIALLALLVLRMPDVASGAAKQQDGETAAPAKPRLRDELRFGWRFIRDSSGLPTMLAIISMLNFFLNLAVVGATPLILSFTDPATFGVIAAAGGAGMVAGGLVMVTWKGPAKRVPLLLVGLCGTGIFIGLYGVRPSAVLVAVAQFGFFFCLPIVNAMGAGIWQRRVPAEAQGRVFAVRRMLATISVPVAIVVGGPLIDNVFKPLLTDDGSLAGMLGPIMGTGPGRGIGVMFVLIGAAMVATTLIAAANPRFRAVEDTVPAAQEPEPSPTAAGGA